MPNVRMPDGTVISNVPEGTTQSQLMEQYGETNKTSTVSTEGMDFIKKWEGFRKDAYLPTPDDVLTIGYGHTIDVKKGDVVTEPEAHDNLIQYVKDNVDTVINDTVTYPLEQNQRDAISSLIYNVGGTAWGKSNALKRLNAGDLTQFKEEAFSKGKGWVKQNGKVLRGLYNRRQEELELFERKDK